MNVRPGPQTTNSQTQAEFRVTQWTLTLTHFAQLEVCCHVQFKFETHFKRILSLAIQNLVYFRGPQSDSRQQSLKMLLSSQAKRINVPDIFGTWGLFFS